MIDLVSQQKRTQTQYKPRALPRKKNIKVKVFNEKQFRVTTNVTNKIILITITTSNYYYCDYYPHMACNMKKKKKGICVCIV